MIAENLHAYSPDTGVDSDNPWPGLVSFTEKEHAYFHGRVEEAEELFRRVARRNLTVLFGQSGLGKSSLLKAGVFPALRSHGYLPVPIRLDHSPTAVSLSEQVIVATERAIREAGGQCEPRPADADDSLWRHFHRRGFRPQTADSQPLRLALVFDQFEELFAVGQASEEARARASQFVNELADLIENRVPRLLEQQMDESPDLVKQFLMPDQDHRFLICLREDYLPHLESLRPTIPSLSENRMRLTRMNGDNALRAVVNPGSHLISPEVGRQVVNFVSGGRVRQLDGTSNGAGDGLADLEVEPSLLSLVCRELNNRRKASGLNRITADLLAGNRERILQDFYERCVADQPGVVRQFVEDELVTDSGLRENVALERAEKTLAHGGVPASVIDQLVSRRLLHVEERLDVQRVELTHDVLTAVIKKSRDERHAREAMRRAEQEAVAIRATARRQRRRLRMIVGGMAIALAIVSAFGISSYWLYRVSEERLVEVELQKQRAAMGEKAAESARQKAEVVKDVFDDATMPVTEDNVRHMAGLGPVQEELARLRIVSLERMAIKIPEDATIPPELAQAYTVLGVIRTYVGSIRAAEVDLKKSGELYAQLAKDHPESLEYRLGEIRVLNHLGYLNWDDNRKPIARRYYQEVMERLEAELKSAPEDPALRYELALTLSRIGGLLPDNISPDEKRALAQRSHDLLKELIAAKYREGDSKTVLSVSSYRLAMLRATDSTAEQRLADLEDVSQLDQMAREHYPDSPLLLSYSYFFRNDQADVLVTTSHFDEALTEREQAVEQVREICLRSPKIYRYADLLAEGLKKLGQEYQRKQRFAEARQAFEESSKLSDEVVARFPDRGKAVSQWIDYRNEAADLYEFGASSHPDGPVQAREDLLRTLEGTITKGRDLAAQFSDHHWTQVGFAKTLSARGRFEREASRPKLAHEYFREAVEIYQTRVFPDEDSTTSEDIDTFLSCAAEAAESAKAADDTQAVLDLVAIAESKRAQCTSRAAQDDLGRVFHVAAQVHHREKRYSEAIAACQKAIDVRKTVYGEAPWHWYIESNLGSSYQQLAESYRELGDFKQEVLAAREYLRIIIGPRYGAKLEPYLDPAQEANEEEANRIREFIEASTKSGMKRFTVPCDFAGRKYPFHVYVTNVPYPNHPLENQARWLREERGGVIPEEVMDSFARLQKIAHENNVSFVDLCVYALGTVDKDEGDNGSKRELDMVATLIVSVDSVASPDEAGGLFAAALSQIVVTREQLSAAPNDVTLMENLALQYEELGSQMLRANQARESMESLQSAVQLREQLLNQFPLETDRVLALTDTLDVLGRAYFQVRSFDPCYACFRRRCDLLEQGEQQSPDEGARANIAACHLIFGEIAEARGTGAEAIHWYQVAAEDSHARAYRKLAHLLHGTSQLVAFLPRAEAAIYARLAKDNAEGSVDFVDAFDKEMTEFKGAPLRAADKRRAANAAQQRGELSEYRDALLAEYEIWKGLAETDPDNAITEASMAEVSLRLGDAFDVEQQSESAFQWMDRAATGGNVDAIFTLSNWYATGKHTDKDPDRADLYRYVAHVTRGNLAFKESRFVDALPDWIEACKSKRAAGNIWNRLGMCYGKLGNWNEAMTAYASSIKQDNYGEDCETAVLNLLEGITCGNQPEKLLRAVASLREKGFKIPEKDFRFQAFYYAFVAIAETLSDHDATTSLAQMRAAISRAESLEDGWSWDEIDRWFDTSSLPNDQKVRVASILGEIGRAVPLIGFD